MLLIAVNQKNSTNWIKPSRKCISSNRQKSRGRFGFKRGLILKLTCFGFSALIPYNSLFPALFCFCWPICRLISHIGAQVAIEVPGPNRERMPLSQDLLLKRLRSQDLPKLLPATIAGRMKCPDWLILSHMLHP